MITRSGLALQAWPCAPYLSSSHSRCSCVCPSAAATSVVFSGFLIFLLSGRRTARELAPRQVAATRPQFGAQLKQVRQQWPFMNGNFDVSHLPQPFCWAQVYCLSGGVSVQGGGAGGLGGAGTAEVNAFFISAA